MKRTVFWQITSGYKRTHWKNVNLEIVSKAQVRLLDLIFQKRPLLINHSVINTGYFFVSEKSDGEIDVYTS